MANTASCSLCSRLTPTAAVLHELADPLWFAQALTRPANDTTIHLMEIAAQRPEKVSSFAQACLEAIAAAGLGHVISIGGAFALAYYHEYRATKDIDAWWTEETNSEERAECLQELQKALGVFGETRLRRWGDVVSVELLQAAKVVFSFQIARRSALLRKPGQAPWPRGLLLDSFEDLLAAKMVALVERGAPRDFRDIYTVCRRRLTTVHACWALWEERQRRAGEDADSRRAGLAVRTHLERLAQVRPLDEIPEDCQRTQARKLREWIVKELLRGMD